MTHVLTTILLTDVSGENGLIYVALLGIIRRCHLRDQVSLRELARRLGISRNTVRRYLRAESVEPTYASRHPALLSAPIDQIIDLVEDRGGEVAQTKKVGETDAYRSVRTGL